MAFIIQGDPPAPPPPDGEEEEEGPGLAGPGT
jgi:hypothetical protein